MFFAQGSDFSFDGTDPSAEERLKSYLAEQGNSLAAASQRRRVVRRPMGSSYPTQTIVFSDRDRDGASASLSTEPLSELLQQLAASRKGQAMPRARDSSSSLLSSLSGLAAAADGADRKSAGSSEPASPAQQLRACFVQELMLSAMSQPLDALDHGPLDVPLHRPLETRPETSLSRDSDGA
jgi:hypothetical protein